MVSIDIYCGLFRQKPSFCLLYPENKVFSCSNNEKEEGAIWFILFYLSL